MFVPWSAFLLGLLPAAAAPAPASRGDGDGRQISLEGVKVLVTAPPSYADRLVPALESGGATALRCPTVVTEHFDRGDDNDGALSEPLRRAVTSEVDSYDYVAFTSRRGVEAAVRMGGPDLLRRLGDVAVRPTAVALGADAEALTSLGVDRSALLVPDDASPAGIVAALCGMVPAEGRARTRVLCPVPLVSGGLREPPVVPSFLSSLRREGFVAHRCEAYRTRWAGPSPAAEAVLTRLRDGDVDAVALSSTAEVEGLLLLCERYGVRLDRCRASVIAHGPVTAAGAGALGVEVAAISSDYSSFDGMRDALALCVGQRGTDYDAT